MEFTELVKERYSCKKYNGKQISNEQLEAILEAGRLAPTAKNLQEQHVYVVQSEEGIKKIDEVTPCRYGAPTVLIVTYDKTNIYMYPGDKKDSGAEDATIVATHMILAAKNAGVESCWLNRIECDKTKELFGLPENEEVVMMMDLGFAAETGIPLPKHFDRKPLSETVSYL